MMFWMIGALVCWFVLSEVIAAIILHLGGMEPGSDDALSFRAAVFLAPVLAGLLIVTWLSWKCYARLYELSQGLLPAPSEHWLEDL